MKAASTGLIALLNSGREFYRADLFTINLRSATGNATRLQSSGGTNVLKYFWSGGTTVNGTVYGFRVLVKNQGITTVTVDNNLGTVITILPGAVQQVSMIGTGDGVAALQLHINTLNVGDSFDIVAANPSVFKFSDGINLITGTGLTFQTSGGWAIFNSSAVTLTQSQEVPNSVLRYTSWGKNLVVNGNTFLAGPPNFKRGSITTAIGLQVQSMDLKVSARPTDLVNGLPILLYIMQKGLNDCIIKVESCFMGTAGDTSLGTVIEFAGVIGDCIDAGRTSVTMQCKNIVALMQQNTPLRVLQPSCWWTLFDAGCTLVRSSFKSSSIVLSGSTVNTLVTPLTQVSGFFDQGVVEFTSGLNIGVKAGVRTQTGGTLVMVATLPNVVAVGDTFDVYPGCDKTFPTCQNKFNNTANWGGQQFIPQPQVIL